MPSSSDWIAVEQKYYAQTVRRQPVVIVRGEGTRVWDADGKEYLDFVAGWAVNNLGHSHPVITQAITMRERTRAFTSPVPIAHCTTPMSRAIDTFLT